MSELFDRVKVGEFLRQGYAIRGLVHIGANDGYEVQWYQQLGIKPILCFEPGLAAFKRFNLKYDDPHVYVFNAALGNLDCDAVLKLTAEDGGSTFLPEPAAVDVEPRVTMYRWASIALELHAEQYNTCVIDVQGMELDVLRGMDEYIQGFDLFVIECSAKPVYKGGAAADEVIAYMNKMGFDQITPTCIHDDILFVKHGLAKTEAVTSAVTRPKGNKLNCGSGQRPFDREFGWINIDINPRWNPDVVSHWGNLTMFDDNTMDIVVSHHSLEHVGCGEGDDFIKEAHRVLKPGGSLLIFVPNNRELCKAYLEGRIDEYIFNVNMYGAFMGDEADRHRWSYSGQGLVDYLRRVTQWHDVHAFNWRQIPGADIAKDWWILGTEAVK